jgi:hypothetical protein
MSIDIRRFLTACAGTVAVAGGALVVAATASADPVPPAPTSPPNPAPAQAAAPEPLAPIDAPMASDQLVAPPNGIPHLASPTAPPLGTTTDPTVMGDDSPNVSYLKDLWEAVQNHDISGKEALMMGLAQRGMNTPYPDQPPGPNVPTSPAAQSDPAALAPPPPARAFPWLPPPPANPPAPTP